MEVKQLGRVVFLLVAGIAFATYGADMDPLEMRWTFGAHEPYTMYRRVGRHCTGGIDGNARWLKPWMDWFDAESPALMEELGLNWLHCRFYKGMGWEEEKKDFPNVKRFVENCHRHGVSALAYVQFSTLYPESMKREIVNLDDWAQIDEDGKKRIYHDGSYFRWMPCITCDEWVEYLKKVCTIALTEGGFDGVMFDNAWSLTCYCERCERRFHEHLMKIENSAERFGFDNLDFVRLPRPAAKALSGEVRDPVVQEWCRWRQETMEDVFARLRSHIKSVKPDAVVCANPQPFRRQEAFARYSLNLHRFVKNLDLVLMQSDNFPEVTASGEIRNRVRDLKICREIGKPVVALCDSDAKLTEARERHYLLPLMEDLIWGGVPTDRTIVSPKPMPGFVDRGMIERRRPQLAAFNAFARAHRGELAAPSYLPVRLLWTPDVIGFSETAHLGLAAEEEILLRNQVPFGYVIAENGRDLAIPSDCEVLVVANQVCLSDAQIAAIVAYAKRGGKLVVTGDSGRYDEWNAQRLENPLKPQSSLADDVHRLRMTELVSRRLEGVTTSAFEMQLPRPSYTIDTLTALQEKFPDQEQFITLLTFDTGHTTWHYDNLPAAQTKDLDWKAYCPGGGTPLYDAIGKGISKTNAQIEDGDHGTWSSNRTKPAPRPCSLASAAAANATTVALPKMHQCQKASSSTKINILFRLTYSTKDSVSQLYYMAILLE